MPGNECYEIQNMKIRRHIGTKKQRARSKRRNQDKKEKIKISVYEEKFLENMKLKMRKVNKLS